MQISREFMLEAVGLSLLVILLLLGTQMFQRATGLMEMLDKEQSRQIESLKEYEITQFDGREIDGVTAVGYIKNMVNHYGLSVYVQTKDREFTIESKEKCAQLKDKESEYYISSFGIYECCVVRDENGGVDYILITEEAEIL